MVVIRACPRSKDSGVWRWQGGSGRGARGGLRIAAAPAAPQMKNFELPEGKEKLPPVGKEKKAEPKSKGTDAKKAEAEAKKAEADAKKADYLSNDEAREKVVQLDGQLKQFVQLVRPRSEPSTLAVRLWPRHFVTMPTRAVRPWTRP